MRALASGSRSSSSTGVSKEIEDLLETQRQVRAQRAQVTKELKNAQRRKQRLKHKARLLTAADLASVLVLRQEEEDAKERTPKRRRSSQPASEATSPKPSAVVAEGEGVELAADDDDEQDSAAGELDDAAEGETRPVA